MIITNNADDEFEVYSILERIKEHSIEEQKIHDGSLDVLAHHFVGLSLQLGKVPVNLAFEIFTKAYPFRNLSITDFYNVLNLLDSNYLIFFDKEKMIFSKKARAYRYYFENLSTIPDILKFKVFDRAGYAARAASQQEPSWLWISAVTGSPIIVARIRFIKRGRVIAS